MYTQACVFFNKTQSSIHIHAASVVVLLSHLSSIPKARRGSSMGGEEESSYLLHSP